MVPAGYSLDFGLNIEKAKKKKKKNDDDDSGSGSGGVDRISELPDEVIVHVLSFLPLRSAAATSLLSRRWINLWKHLPNLKFDNLGTYTQLYHLFSSELFRRNTWAKLVERSQLCMHKYIDWVNSVIQSYDSKASLQQFSIAVIVDEPNQHQVTKWLEFAFSRRVQTLELLSTRRLVNAGVLADMLKGMNIPSSGFRSLKVLWLRSFIMSSEAIEFLLRCCPMLERLVLDSLRVTTDLEVTGGASLKHLDMHGARFFANSVKIRAPDLTWLTIRHQVTEVSFAFENVPKLVNMTFYCRRCSLTDAMHDFARQLETLVIFLSDPPEENAFSVPKMPSLKKLVVYDRFHSPNVLLPVASFMRAAPALEDFRIDVSELGVETKVFQFPKEDEQGQEQEHRHLRRFVLSAFCGDRIELLRYVVNYCVALEEIVIGQCNREGLLRDLVDYYCVPLHYIIPKPKPKPKPIHDIDDYVATPQDRQDIYKLVRLFTPPRIKLRVL